VSETKEVVAWTVSVGSNQRRLRMVVKRTKRPLSIRNCRAIRGFDDVEKGDQLPVPIGLDIGDIWRVSASLRRVLNVRKGVQVDSAEEQQGAE
jgi:hypothetical protein